MSILERFRLDGRRALVTGASRGIGRAIALAFAEAGADVALTARSEDALRETVRAIEDAGGRAVAVPADLYDIDAARGAVQSTVEALGGLDILVNNAGTWTLESMDGVTPDELDRVMSLNLRTPVFLTQAAAPHLKASGSGVVVNISSIGAVRVRNVYGASKAALDAWTHGLARAWGKHGVRVVAIAPGMIETYMSRSELEDPDKLAAFLNDTFLGRTGVPDEIAAAALFLASDAASFVTDVVLEVSGGRIK